MEHAHLASTNKPSSQQHSCQQIEAIFHEVGGEHSKSQAKHNEDFWEIEKYAQPHAKKDDHC